MQYRQILFVAAIVALLPSVTIAQPFAPQTAIRDTKTETAQQKLYKDGVQSLSVKHADVEEVAKLLNEQFSDFTFTANKKISRIYFRAPNEVHLAVREFFDDLEEHAKQYMDLKAKQQRESEGAAKLNALPSYGNDPNMFAGSIGKSNEKLSIETLRLKFINGEEFGRVVRELGLIDQDVLMSVNPDGASVTVRGRSERIEEILKIAQFVDTPRPATDIVLSEVIRSDPTNSVKTGTVWPVHTTVQSVESMNQSYADAENAATELGQILRRMKDKTSDEAKQLNKKLNAAVRRAFEQRQRLQLAELDAHRAKLKAIGDRLSRRAQLADVIVQRRVAQLGGFPTEPSDQTDQLGSTKKSKVEIETTKQGVIVLRGKQEDVKRVSETLKEATNSQKAADPEPAKKPAETPSAKKAEF